MAVEPMANIRFGQQKLSQSQNGALQAGIAGVLVSGLWSDGSPGKTDLATRRIIEFQTSARQTGRILALLYAAIGRPFSLIGYAVDDPLDDRVEPFPVECVFAVDAELGDEIAGDPGHDLVCIPRILVLRARHNQGRPWFDG